MQYKIYKNIAINIAMFLLLLYL